MINRSDPKSPTSPCLPDLEGKHKQGDAMGACEVRRGTSTIHFHSIFPFLSSHISPETRLWRVEEKNGVVHYILLLLHLPWLSWRESNVSSYLSGINLYRQTLPPPPPHPPHTSFALSSFPPLLLLSLPQLMDLACCLVCTSPISSFSPHD